MTNLLLEETRQYRLAGQLLFSLKAVILPAQTSATQRSWAEVVVATQMAVVVEEVLLDIAALAEQVVAISLVVETLGPAVLAAVVEEEAVDTITKTISAPALGSFGLERVAAELDYLVLALAALAVPVELHLVIRLVAAVGRLGVAVVVLLAMLATLAHMEVGLAGLASTKTAAHMGLLPTALSVLSASSGVLVAPIRQTPQTSN
jgi:hypothetical protein